VHPHHFIGIGSGKHGIHKPGKVEVTFESLLFSSLIEVVQRLQRNAKQITAGGIEARRARITHQPPDRRFMFDNG
jgi:hypothetical protein